MSTWQPTPVFSPGEFHGQRSLAGCSPWGCNKSDTTEAAWHAHNSTRLRDHLGSSQVALMVKKHACQCRRCKKCRFDPWLRKIPWKRAWQPTPVLLPEESHGLRNLAATSIRSRRVGHNWSDLAHAPEITWLCLCVLPLDSVVPVC